MNRNERKKWGEIAWRLPSENMDPGRQIIAVYGNAHVVGYKHEFDSLPDFSRKLMAWCYRDDMVASAMVFWNHRDDAEETTFDRIKDIIAENHPGYCYLVVIMPNEVKVEASFMTNLTSDSMAELAKKLMMAAANIARGEARADNGRFLA